MSPARSSMPHRSKTLLSHILSASALVTRFVAGRTYENYLEDDLLRSAIERQFITIGEALRSLSANDGATATRITEARRIINFRNVLVHGYDAIASPLVWDIIQTDLPVLRAEVEALLAED